MGHWLDRILDLLEADTTDLRELACLAGGDPESFYIGTSIDRADLRGQNLEGMTFGPFDPRTVRIDDATILGDALHDIFSDALTGNPEAVIADDDASKKAAHVRSRWVDTFSGDLAVDLDSHITRIYRKGRGLILEEPSVYLARKGREARGMVAGSEAIGRLQAESDSSLNLVSPFARGNIADERFGTALVRLLLKQALGRTRLGGDAVLCVPFEATPVQRRAIAMVMKNVGARGVSLIDRGLSSAIGAGLPVHEMRGALIIDVGYATTDVAVVCLSGTVVGKTISAGTASMNHAIQEAIARIYGTNISLEQSEQLRAEFGGVRRTYQRTDKILMQGNLRTSGAPREFMLSASVVVDAMNYTVSQIIDVIRAVLEETPPELALELSEDGIVMTGLGANIPGLDAELRDHTGLPVRVARDPQLCAVMGCAKVLEHPKWRKGVASQVVGITRT